MLEPLEDRSLLNAAPIAYADYYTVTHDHELIATTGGWPNGVLSTDYDPDNDAISIIDHTEPLHGTLALAANGGFHYQPEAGFVGQVFFAYTISDGALTATATVTINVTNQAPNAYDDWYAVKHDTTLTTTNNGWPSGVKSTDYDPDGDALSITKINNQAVTFDTPLQLSQGGWLTMHADGTFAYTPASGFVGQETFTYTLSDGISSDDATVTLNVTNQAPYAYDDWYTLKHDSTLTTTNNTWPAGVLSMDYDPDGDPLTLVAVNGSATHIGSTISLASGAQLTVNADGTFTYVATAGFVGNDTFTYTISDGIASATATAHITVTNQAPYAYANWYTVKHDTMLTALENGMPARLLAMASDMDDDALSVTKINGVASNLHTEITLPSGARLLVKADGTFNYKPVAGFVGTDSFTYTVSDGIAESTAVATIQITNQTPYVSNPWYTLKHDTTLTAAGQGMNGGLLYMANDGDGDRLSVTKVNGVAANVGSTITLASGAALAVAADGSLSYTPLAGTVGSDSFTFTVSDGLSETTGTATLNITNQAPWSPMVMLDGYAPTTHAPLTATVSGSDPDGDTLTYTWQWLVNGNVVLTETTTSKTSTFDLSQPGQGDRGQTVTVNVTASDGLASSMTNATSVTVANSAPAAVSDTVLATRNTPLTFAPLLNDLDPDYDTLSISYANNGMHGSVALNNDGTVTYTPYLDYVGPDSFSYTIHDGHGGYATGLVDIMVAQQEVVWDGDAVDSLGSSALNWSGDALPTEDDILVFDGTSTKDAILDESFLERVAGIRIEASYQGKVIIRRDLEVTGALENYGQVAVEEGTLTLRGGGKGSGDFEVAQGAVLHLSGGQYYAEDDAEIDGDGVFLIAVDVARPPLNQPPRIFVPAGAEPVVRAELRLEAGGTVDGPGTLQLTRSLSWLGGTMIGNGVTKLMATCQNSFIAGQDVKELSQRRLENYGTLTLTDRALTVSNGATIINGGILIVAGNETGLTAGMGALGAFLNRGTFRRTSANATDNATIAIRFTNHATFDVQGGMLTMTATFTQSTLLNWWPLVPQLTIQLNAVLKVRDLQLSEGELSLAGTLTVQAQGLGQMRWGDVDLIGGGLFAIEAGAHLFLESTRTVDAAIIENSGTVHFLSRALSFVNNAMFINKSGASFLIETGGEISGDAASVFTNYGTVSMMSNGAFRFNILFDSLIAIGQQQPSIVEANQGRLQLRRNGIFQAAFRTQANGQIFMSNGVPRVNANYTFLDGTVLNGRITIRASTATLAGTVMVDGNVSITDTRLSGPGATLQNRLRLALDEVTFVNLALLRNTANATLVIDANVTLDSTILENMPQATIDWQGGDINILSGTPQVRRSLIQNDGQFNIAADDVVTNDAFFPSDGLVNTGTIIKTGGIQTIIQVPVTNKDNGQINLNAKQITFAGGMWQQGSATIQVGGGILEAAVVTQTGGTLRLGGGVLAVFTGGLHMFAETRLEGHGLILGNVFNNAGTIDLRVSNAGNPGYGLLLIIGDCIQAGTLTLNLTQRAGLRYDRLLVWGSASLAGTLQVTAPVPPLVAINDRFAVVWAAAISGNFETYQLPGLPNPRAWAANPVPSPTSLELVVQ